MKGAKLGILKEPGQVHLCSFLDGEKCLRLEPELFSKFSSNIPDEALERKSLEKKLDTFLIELDFSECDSTWLESSSPDFALILLPLGILPRL